ncbi:MAG TPA: sigma-70 family RNA polymerase sigma factor [Frankiaceae bacterium]|nr:sigma-70 family RNA polymerase sigma factor [Frankiaceae bacterium]
MDDDDRARRWDLVLPHRARLLAIARHLVHDPGDAEACVQEALTRCVTFPGLDESNVAGFLVVTTRRLCTDHYRAHAHTTRVTAKLTARTADEPGIDEAVCDRAEAAWVTERLADLPARQRDVVLARAAGQSPQEIAEHLAVSYKTVETLLYRVRVRARTELERTYAGISVLVARWARPDVGAVGAAGLAVATAGTAALLATPPLARPAALPTPPAVTRAAAPARVVRVAAVPVLTSAPRPPLPSQAARPLPSPTRTPPTLSPCDFPPYFADPCVEPDPSDPPILPLLNCVRYGFSPTGFACNTAPPEESRRPTPEGDE